MIFRTVGIFFCALILMGTMSATTMGATKILGSADGETSGSRIDVTQLKRVPGNMVELKFVMVNDSSTTLDTSWRFGATSTEYATIGGVYLEDPVGSTKYVVLRDTQSACVCSSHLTGVPAKSKITLWATFLAPPESVTKLNVVLPHFQPVEDVPLTPLPK